MIRSFTPTVCRAAVALLAVLAGASCDHADMPNSPTETPPATTAADSGTLADTVALADPLAPASVSYSGLPYGPIGLWKGTTDFEWGPAPFTSSQDNTYANSIVSRINTARLKKQRLILAMTGGKAPFS